MSNKTRIEWTDATWNPVTGCTKVSQGCKHCYAEREWPRMTKLVPAYAGRKFSDVRTHADRLDRPLHWKKPRRIFVNSMSDLFHEDISVDFIGNVFEIMARCPQHTFQILTKRAGRMQFLLWSELDWKPLPNVWLGVSVEDQASADERIPMLLQTPAAVRWISAEPLLGPIDLTPAYRPCPNAHELMMDTETGAYECCHKCDYTGIGDEMGIDWVVVGGESGPKARPMHPQWARSLRDQCLSASVPFLFKQHGEWIHDDDIDNCGLRTPEIADAGQHFKTFDWPHENTESYRVGKKSSGRLLDGVQHDGYPKGAK